MASSAVKKSRVKVIAEGDGHLPLTELTSDRPAAGSPFGDDLTFPLPVEGLNWEHSEPVGPRLDSYAGGH